MQQILATDPDYDFNNSQRTADHGNASLRGAGDAPSSVSLPHHTPLMPADLVNRSDMMLTQRAY